MTIQKCFCTLFLFLCFFNGSLKGEEDLPLRIRELIPISWSKYPSVDPAIPDNFKMKEGADMAAIWGTEEDLEIFEPTAPLKGEVIRLAHSLNSRQTGPDSFFAEETFVKDMEDMGCKVLNYEKLWWGPYPVRAIEVILPNGMYYHQAWVGLNDGGTVIDMRHYTSNRDTSDAPIWDRFIHETKVLDEYDFFRSIGMHMKDGYTNYSSILAKLKVTGERRKSDGLVAVMIEPISPDTSYEIHKVFETYMGSKWKFGSPCIKINGTTTESGGQFGTCVIDATITVLTKEVEEFSFDLDPKKHAKGVLIHQLPLDLKFYKESQELQKELQKQRLKA